MLKRAGDKRPDVKTFARLAGFYENMRDYVSAAAAWKKAIPLAQEPEQHKLKMQLGLDRSPPASTTKPWPSISSLQQEDSRSSKLPGSWPSIYRQKGQYDKAQEQLDKAKLIDAYQP